MQGVENPESGLRSADTKPRLAKRSIDRSDINVFRTPVLRALSDETRQGIIILLGKHKSLCVNDLAAYFNVSRPTVSHHLSVLREAKMILGKKSGKEIYYSLNLRYIRRTMKNLLRLVDTLDLKNKKRRKNGHTGVN